MTVIPFKASATYHPYRISVDGFKIGEISLPAMTQNERDQVRNNIAASYHVPRHYIRLSRMRAAA